MEYTFIVICFATPLLNQSSQRVEEPAQAPPLLLGNLFVVSTSVWSDKPSRRFPHACSQPQWPQLYLWRNQDWWLALSNVNRYCYTQNSNVHFQVFVVILGKKHNTFIYTYSHRSTACLEGYLRQTVVQYN